MRVREILLGVGVGVAWMGGLVPPAWAGSLFNGLVLTEGDEPGVVIEEVGEETAADLAGLRPGEVITAMEGTPIRTLEDYVQASQAIKKSGARQTLVEVRHRGEARRVALTGWSVPIWKAWGLRALEPGVLDAGGRAPLEWRGAGDDAMRRGASAEAADAYVAALHTQPEDVSAAIGLARTFVQRGNVALQVGESQVAAPYYRDAIQLYRQALTRELSVGQAQDVKAALETVEQALNRVPR